MLDMYRTKKINYSAFTTLLNFFNSSGGPSKLRLHGTSNPPSVIVERRRGPVTVQVSLPPFFINKQHNFDISEDARSKNTTRQDEDPQQTECH